MATFRKNNKGEWVVFGSASEVKPGKMWVEKKGGGKSPVEVASVGRPFFANGQQMVYGYIALKEAAPARTPAPVSYPSYEESPEEDGEIAAERRANTQEAYFSAEDMGF